LRKALKKTIEKSIEKNKLKKPVKKPVKKPLKKIKYYKIIKYYQINITKFFSKNIIILTNHKTNHKDKSQRQITNNLLNHFCLCFLNVIVHSQFKNDSNSIEKEAICLQLDALVFGRRLRVWIEQV